MSAPAEMPQTEDASAARELLRNVSERSYDLKLKAALVYAVLDVAAAMRELARRSS